MALASYPSDDEINDKVAALYICPICTERPTYTLYQCANGHIICHRCYRTLQQRAEGKAVCPTCRIGLNVFDKNKMTLKVRAPKRFSDQLGYCAFPCTNLGCNKLMRLHQVARHERRSCIFNQFGHRVEEEIPPIEPPARSPYPLNTHFQKAFRCEVCRKLAIRGLNQCASGHVYCDYCFSRTEICVLCFNDLAVYDERSNPIRLRSLILEQMMEEIRFPCVFNTDGCFVYSKHTELDEHIRHCPFNVEIVFDNMPPGMLAARAIPMVILDESEK